MSSNIWFSSDLHFGHKKVIQSSNRPFKSIEENDEVLIQNWNSVVKAKDTIYFLGDFAFCNKETAVKIRNRLNGQIFFIRGNHDRTAYQIKNMFGWFKDVYSLHINDQNIWLSHYAHLVWPKMHYGTWHFFGHSHSSLNKVIAETDVLKNKQMIDVGVDCWNYFPVNYDQLSVIMKSKPKFEPIDHHQ